VDVKEQDGDVVVE